MKKLIYRLFETFLGSFGASLGIMAGVLMLALAIYSHLFGNFDPSYKTSDVITAISTMVIAVFTIFLYLENNRLRKISTDPNIIFTTRVNSEVGNLLRIEMENAGAGPAFNFEFTEIELITGNKELCDTLINVGFIKEKGYKFPPQYTFSTNEVSSLDSKWVHSDNQDSGNSLFQTKIKFTYRYENFIGEKVVDSDVVDFSLLGGYQQLKRNGLHEIHKILEGVDKSLKTPPFLTCINCNRKIDISSRYCMYCGSEAIFKESKMYRDRKQKLKDEAS